MHSMFSFSICAALTVDMRHNMRFAATENRVPIQPFEIVIASSASSHNVRWRIRKYFKLFLEVEYVYIERALILHFAHKVKRNAARTIATSESAHRTRPHEPHCSDYVLMAFKCLFVDLSKYGTDRLNMLSYAYAVCTSNRTNVKSNYYFATHSIYMERWTPLSVPTMTFYNNNDGNRAAPQLLMNIYKLKKWKRNSKNSFSLWNEMSFATMAFATSNIW